MKRKIILLMLASTLLLTSCSSSEPTYVENSEMTLNFDYGDRTGTYTGQVRNSLPDGYGSFSTVNDDGVSWVYYGEWDNGHFSNYGITEWDNGQIHLGQYNNDMYDGYGVFINPDNSIDCGKFSNGSLVEVLTSSNVQPDNSSEPSSTNYIFSDSYTRAAVWVESSFGDKALYSEIGNISDKSGEYFQVVVPTDYTVDDAKLAWDSVVASTTMLTISGLEYKNISISFNNNGSVILNVLLSLSESGDYELSCLSGDLTHSTEISSSLSN